MLDRLELIYKRYNQLSQDIGKAEVIAVMDNWKKLVKEHSQLEPIVDEYKKYLKISQDLNEYNDILKESKDKELVELANMGISEIKNELEKSIENLKVLLLPKDPNDDKNVVMEIRAGAGGDEAGLFGTELTKMYMYYAESMRWKVEELDMNYNDLGGVKEVVFLIKGTGAYKNLKFESGVHRVQRVPETESQGRVHTSTVTVAVLPEVEDVEVEINEKDLKIDTYRSGGAGGQHVNKTESAIRITHLPTNTVVTCQDEKSQVKNKEKAIKILKSRLYDYYQSKADKQYADNRKLQIGTGDRSERIRTYNYPQGRVTDHRINYTIYSLPEFLSGNIGAMCDALQLAMKNQLLGKIDN